MVAVDGGHARREDQAEAAVVSGRVRQSRTSADAAHGALDDTPSRGVRFPAPEGLAVEDLHAPRVGIGPSSRIRRGAGNGLSLAVIGAAADQGDDREGGDAENREDLRMIHGLGPGRPASSTCC